MALLDDIKDLIFRVENEKPEEKPEDKKEVENEKVDKRKLIDEVSGILKGKVDDEIIRTIIGKLEKLSYDESEAGTADNGKEVKNEDPEDKEKVEDLEKDEKKDVENKCGKSVKNSKGEDYYSKLMKIYNSSVSVKEKEPEYVSRVDREKAAEDYFKA